MGTEMDEPHGHYQPRVAPRFTPEQRARLVGREVIYCPECGWWIADGAPAGCGGCGTVGRLRFWVVDD